MRAGLVMYYVTCPNHDSENGFETGRPTMAAEPGTLGAAPMVVGGGAGGLEQSRYHPLARQGALASTPNEAQHSDAAAVK